MCGIAGLYNAPHGAMRNREYVSRMLARIGHRGPDGVGLYFEDNLAFGTARLSIVDPAGGDQPIGDETRRYWIAFNGEIYNHGELRDELALLGHVFQTRSDTEVLLKAWMTWGSDALPRLNGAFAAAFYDRTADQLVLCRDRYGKRPLYYSEQNGTLSFASEIKSFLDYDPISLAIDPSRLASIYRTWTPVGNQSCFEGIHQLPAGTVLTATSGGCDIRSYAPLDLGGEPSGLSEADAIDITRQKMADSVRLRLKCDVAVGTYVSGGLDSAIITGLAAENVEGQLKTFSVTFADPKFDESLEQELVSQHFGTEHHAIRIGDDDIATTFPQALWHAETPVFRSAFVPMYLLSRTAREQGVKVVLTGEGADEAFLGYDIFKEVQLRASWRGLDAAERRRRLAQLYPYLEHFNSRNQNDLYAYFDRSDCIRQDDMFSHALRFRSSLLATRLLAADYDGLHDLQRLIDDERTTFDGLSLTQRTQWLEFNTLLGGYLLSTQGDRMALAHGVENRCPFLDHDVVRWGAVTNRPLDGSLPEKYLLKRAFADRLPAKAVDRSKQPYLAPDAAAFVETRPDYMEIVLSEAELKKVAALDSSFCRRLINKVMAKSGAVSQAENQAFMLMLSTALLHHQFVAQPASTPRSPLVTKEIDGRTAAVY